jgi:hypothetical protein
LIRLSAFELREIAMHLVPARFKRPATISILALLTATLISSTASADHRHRMRILWPKIFAPEVSGYLYRDELDEEDDSFFDLEDEADYRARNRRDRRVVLELYDDEDYEPQYQPPKLAKPKKTTKKLVSRKPVVKSTKTTAAISKPKPAAMVKTAAKPRSPEIVTSKQSIITQASAANPKTEPPKSQAVTVPPKVEKPNAQVASATAAAGTIGCGKGAEIVSGYGFTSVKPRSCTGTSYSFDASRGASGYLIKLSAATGEITDVTKLK